VQNANFGLGYYRVRLHCRSHPGFGCRFIEKETALDKDTEREMPILGVQSSLLKQCLPIGG
jgi:hypothetical protein